MQGTRGMCAVALLALCACGSDSEGSDKSPEDQAIESVKGYVSQEIQALHDAAVELQEAAPAPDADGWNATDDADAVARMKAAWAKARASYERIEGAIAVLFGDLDESTDQRYDFFVADAPDANPFDGDGVTGVHGIERILWADEIPANVVTFESALPNYAAASFPETMKEADDFKNGLVKRLIDDAAEMDMLFEPLALDLPTAYAGVIGSMEEQIEKVTLSETGEDESRYAQHTLADMRANLEGGKEIFAAFTALFDAKGAEGKALRDKISASFARIQAEYDRISGNAIPPVPAMWNPSAPTPDQLATDYGKLHALLTEETDFAREESLVSLMQAGAKQTGIEE
jgi:iron uptake system component EfeO